MDAIEKHIICEYNRLIKENGLVEKWIKSDEEHRCAVCGKPIKNISIQRRVRPYKWDTRKCFEYKPRKIIHLEQEYGLDIKDILIEVTRRYGNIKSQCQALGISVPYLYAIIRKYFGDYLQFMVKYATGRRKQNYLRKFKEREQH